MKKCNSLNTLLQTNSLFSDQRFKRATPSDRPLENIDQNVERPKFVRLRPLQKMLSSPPSKLSRESKLERINTLRLVSGVISQYENNGGQFSESICRDVQTILGSLVKEESTYGTQMNKFFSIMEKMIFCHNQQAISLVAEVNEPYSVLVNRALEQQMQKMLQKQSDIDAKINRMNSKILEIEQGNQCKLRNLKIQYQNNVAALNIEHKRETNQLCSQIEQLKQQLQTKNIQLAKLSGPDSGSRKVSRRG